MAARESGDVINGVTAFLLLRGIKSIAADTKRVSDAIDVVKPRSDECDLQDAAVVKTGCAQALMIVATNLRGIARDPHNVIKHHAFGGRNRRSRKVVLQRFD
jgi:hypothetical protein